MFVLEFMQKNVLDVGGKMLNVFGKGMFFLEIDNFLCNVIVVVVELIVDGIIGLDFLIEYWCMVDVLN